MPAVKVGGGRIMLWGCFLVPVKGNVNVLAHCDIFLYFYPFSFCRGFSVPVGLSPTAQSSVQRMDG